MIVKPKVLTKLMTQAYKGCGLRIEVGRKWTMISGGYWTFYVRPGALNNIVKAKVVELVGDMPGVGSAITVYAKEEPQIALCMECDPDDRFQKDTQLIETFILLQHMDKEYRVMEGPGSMRLLCNRVLTDMITEPSEAEILKGETSTDGPWSDGDRWIRWDNSMCVFIAGTVHPWDSDVIDFLRKTVGHEERESGVDEGNE